MRIFKKVIIMFSFITTIFLCSSCSFIFNFSSKKVEEFGRIGFANSHLFGCIDWLYFNDDLYYYVASLDCEVEYNQALGAFNEGEFGYTLYSLIDEKYSGIAILEQKGVMSTVKYVYAHEDVEYVPCNMLHDIPHIDSLFNGGGNFELNGVMYANYYSTEPNLLEKGEEIGSVNDITYYSILGYNDFICSVNKKDSTRLNMHYKTSIENFPMFFVKLANPYSPTFL